MLKRVKYFFGFESFGRKEIEKLERSNMKAAAVLTGIIIMVELWMIYRVFNIAYFGQEMRTLEWVIVHLRSYVLLLGASIVTLVHALLYLNGRRIPHILSVAIHAAYCMLCLSFGIYISYLDYCNGEALMAFITMVVFVVCVYTWHPVVTFTITSLSFGIMYYLCTLNGDVSIATNINLFTVWLAVTVAGIRGYHNRFDQ